MDMICFARWKLNRIILMLYLKKITIFNDAELMEFSHDHRFPYEKKRAIERLNINCNTLCS